MTPDREAPTRPTPSSRPAAPSPGPPRDPDRLPLPRPSLRGVAPPIFGSPSFRIDSCVPFPTLLPRAMFGLPGRLGPPGCSLAPSSSLSHRLPVCRPVFILLPGPSGVQQTAWWWGPRKAGVGGHLLPLASECTVNSPTEGGFPTCQSPLPSRAISRLTCSPLPRPKGGSQATWEFRSPSINWELGTWVGVLVPGLFLDGISHLRPFL